MPDEPSLPDDAQRELAARRKDLEREFDDKARELKAQHKRQMDRLEQDRLDWEGHKRTQAKELADKAERYRRKETNEQQVVQRSEATREEVQALKDRVADLEASKLKATVTQAGLEQRAAGAKEALKGARTVLLAFAIVTLAAAAIWLVVALQTQGTAGIGWPAVALALAFMLNLWRIRVLAKAT